MLINKKNVSKHPSPPNRKLPKGTLIGKVIIPEHSYDLVQFGPGDYRMKDSEGNLYDIPPSLRQIESGSTFTISAGRKYGTNCLQTSLKGLTGRIQLL